MCRTWHNNIIIIGKIINFLETSEEFHMLCIALLLNSLKLKPMFLSIYATADCSISHIASLHVHMYCVDLHKRKK